MSTPDDRDSPLRVGELLIAVDARCVKRGGRVLDISGLTFDFLLALVDCAPALATYDELSQRVWKGRPVTPETIAQRAKLLRAALGDDANTPRYFEPIRGHGYRLLVNVEPSHDTAPPPQRQQFPWVVAGALVAVVALVSFFLLQPPSAREPSIAVLPFADMSADGDQGYFGEGIAEQLIDELTRLDGIKVASRTASFEFRGTKSDPSAIGTSLGVTHLLEGSVRKGGDTLRITAQLIDASDGYHVWSQTFDREMADLLAVQDEIAGAVAGALGVTLSVGDVNAFAGAGTSSIGAYEAYLRAMRIERWDLRRQLLERAIRLDPNYGAALAGLGLSIAATQWFRPPQEAPEIRERAMPHIARAVALAPDSAFAKSLMAVVGYANYGWQHSDDLFREALLQRPDGETLEHYGNMLMRAGRSSAALAFYEAAANADRHPIVDVGSLDIQALLALRRFDEIEQLMTDGGLEASVNIAELRYLLALNRGDVEALKESFGAWLRSGGSASLVQALAALGQHLDSGPSMIAALRALMADEDLAWPSKHHDLALLAAFYGAHDLALEWMSFEARLTSVRYGALWQPVMAQARTLAGFRQLVTDVRLVDYWRSHGWGDHCVPAEGHGLRCF